MKKRAETAVAFKKVQEERGECGPPQRVKKFYVPERIRRGHVLLCRSTLRGDNSETHSLPFSLSLDYVACCAQTTQMQQNTSTSIPILETGLICTGDDGPLDSISI